MRIFRKYASTIAYKRLNASREVYATSNWLTRGFLARDLSDWIRSTARRGLVRRAERLLDFPVSLCFARQVDRDVAAVELAAQELEERDGEQREHEADVDEDLEDQGALVGGIGDVER